MPVGVHLQAVGGRSPPAAEPAAAEARAELAEAALLKSERRLRQQLDENKRILVEAERVETLSSGMAKCMLLTLASAEKQGAALEASLCHSTHACMLTC